MTIRAMHTQRRRIVETGECHEIHRCGLELQRPEVDALRDYFDTDGSEPAKNLEDVAGAGVSHSHSARCHRSCHGGIDIDICLELQIDDFVA